MEKSPRAFVTTPDRKRLLAPLPLTPGAAGTAIIVDDSRRSQTIQGFGGALTDSSAYLLWRLPAKRRDAVLRDLFAVDGGGVGFSVLRLPMGASDFSSRGSYTYNDLAPGEKDPEQKRFSIRADETYILPLLRRIRQINPQLTLIASPWSAPAWMKTNHNLNGGWLDWPAYGAFARYFVRFIEAYRRAGVPVDYVTVQNEPRMESNTYPSMRMEPGDQARFIRDHLGPAFRAAGIKTKILIWDHNWDVPQYPLEILKDDRARGYVAGVAWHAYAGKPEAQETVRRAFPKQEVHFTESSGGVWASDFGGNIRWDTENLIVGATRYGAQTVLKWNLVLDPAYGPRNGGCPNCRGMITLEPRTGAVTKNEEYYAFGHASRFVRPGARHIASTAEEGLPNTAFRNRDGSLVWVAANLHTDAPRTVTVSARSHPPATLTIPAGAVVTVVWYS